MLNGVRPAHSIRERTDFLPGLAVAADKQTGPCAVIPPPVDPDATERRFPGQVDVDAAGRSRSASPKSSCFAVKKTQRFHLILTFRFHANAFIHSPDIEFPDRVAPPGIDPFQAEHPDIPRLDRGKEKVVRRSIAVVHFIDRVPVGLVFRDLNLIARSARPLPLDRASANGGRAAQIDFQPCRFCGIGRAPARIHLAVTGIGGRRIAVAFRCRGLPLRLGRHVGLDHDRFFRRRCGWRRRWRLRRATGKKNRNGNRKAGRPYDFLSDSHARFLSLTIQMSFFE